MAVPLKYGFLALLLLILSACSKSAKNTAVNPVICPTQLQDWYNKTSEYFLQESSLENHQSIALFLKKLVGHGRSGCDNRQQTDFSSVIPEQTQPAEHGQPAISLPLDNHPSQIDSRQKLLLAHQLSFLGELYVEGVGAPLFADTASTYVKSLRAFVAQFAHLDKSKVEFYTDDLAQNILAYYRSNDQHQRLFAIFNLTYDFHPIPFPLGFMSSTKIKIWRTDDPETREFVTNQTLYLRPLSGAIVLVD